MKKFLPIITILLLYIIFAPVTYAIEQPSYDVDSYILVDAKTGKVLAEYNSNTKHSPASTTKIMTALVAVQNADIDDIFTASERSIYSIETDYVRAGIMPNEELTLESLLNFMLITSANETANIIAENVSNTSTIEGFVDMMNDEAEKLGLKNTHFANPYGKDNEEHYTTASDLAKMAIEAMKHDEIRNVVRRDECPYPDTNFRKSEDWVRLSTTNKIIGKSTDYFESVNGIKTGFTNEAGYCLVSSAYDNSGLELIAVILGAESYDSLFSQSIDLLDYGFKNFKYQVILNSGSFVSKESVIDADPNQYLEIITNGEVTELLPVEEKDWNIERKTFLNTPFTAPIEEGTVLGKYEWYSSDEMIGSVELIAKNSIEKSMKAKIRDEFNSILKNKTLRIVLISIVAFFVFIIILRFFLKRISRNVHKRKRRKKVNGRKNNYRINRYTK